MIARPRIEGLCLALVLVGAGGCGPLQPSADDCGRILDRIVELALAERGFRDPVLAGHWKVTFHRLLARELDRCEELALEPESLTCAARAGTADALAECLR